MDDHELTDLQPDLLDALVSTMVVTDPAGDILLWNPAAERLYGYPRSQMQGANVMKLFVAEANTAEAQSIMEKVLAGESWTGEFPVARADGTHISVRITDSPVIRDGQVVAVVGLAEPVADEQAGAAATPSVDGCPTWPRRSPSWTDSEPR